MTIFLVRHGQTAFNAARRWQGQVDSPLTALGVEQARLMGATVGHLVNARNVRLVSSSLGRAVDTARIIRRAADVCREIELDPRLMEIGMGSWDGLTDFELNAEFSGALEGLQRHDWFFHSPDGEAYDVFAERLEAALSNLASKEGDCVVVSHGVAGRVLRGLHLGLSKDEALNLDAPQNVVFELCADGISWHEC